MKVYLDSSVVLGRILREPRAFTDWSSWEWVVTSELARVETMRTLDRLRIRGRLSDGELADAASLLRSLLTIVEQVRIEAAILQRAAAPFPTALGTLDAIQLASALLWTEEHGQPLVFLTHDAELAMAARACGLDVRMKP